MQTGLLSHYISKIQIGTDQIDVTEPRNVKTALSFLSSNGKQVNPYLCSSQAK